MTFKERYLAGEIPFEDIDLYIEEWNESDDERRLAQFLGLDADEEDVWVDESDEALKEMLDRQRYQNTIRTFDVLRRGLAAALGGDPGAAPARAVFV